MISPKNIRQGVGITGHIPTKGPRSTTRATSPGLRGPLQTSNAKRVGSRPIKKAHITGSCVQEFAGSVLLQEFAGSVFLLAAALVFARWIRQRVRTCENERDKKGDDADTTRSLVHDGDLEYGASGAIMNMGSDIECAAGADLILLFSEEWGDVERVGVDIESTDMIVALKKEEGGGRESREKSSERSCSILTICASSAGDISLFGSQPTDTDDGGSVSNSADSCGTWKTDQTRLDGDNDHIGRSTPGSVEALAAMEMTSLPFNSNGARGLLENEALSARTLSSTTSDKSVIFGSFSEFSINTNSGRNSRTTTSTSSSVTSDNTAAGSNGITSGGGGSSSYSGNYDDDGDDVSCVSDYVLMAVLRRPGIMTGGGERARGMMARYEDLEQRSLPSTHQHEPGASIKSDSEDENFPSISVEGDEHAEGNGEERNAAAGERETEEGGGKVGGGLPGSSPGSLPEGGSFEIDASLLAKRRTAGLVEILRRGPMLSTALSDIHLARHCDLDLSTGHSNADLTSEEVIGAGHYGRVSRVRHESSGRTMAMKELTEDAEEYHRDCASNEMATFLCLGSHPNIPKVLAVNSALPTMPILMELGHCDMVDVVASSTVSMRHKIGILYDAACGLKHMHEKGQVHRDVKAGNIIITVNKEDGRPTGKVADFGFTCAKGEITDCRTGTPGYIPVELLCDDAEAGPESDVFSFAVLVVETLVLPELWEDNMFAHSSLLTAEEEEEFASLDEDDEDGFLDVQFEVVQRTLEDNSFAMEILQPCNIQGTIYDKHGVCGWLQACLCQPRERRPSMSSMVEVLRCMKERIHLPPMAMLHQA